MDEWMPETAPLLRPSCEALTCCMMLSTSCRRSTAGVAACRSFSHLTVMSRIRSAFLLCLGWPASALKFAECLQSEQLCQEAGPSQHSEASELLAQTIRGLPVRGLKASRMGSGPLGLLEFLLRGGSLGWTLPFELVAALGVFAACHAAEHEPTLGQLMPRKQHSCTE